MEKVLNCKCGAKARKRYRDPYLWIECDKKCGMKTGFHKCSVVDDFEVIKCAIEEWNRMNKS